MIQKELAEGAGRNRLEAETENGAWITDIPHKLSWEEFQEKVLL